MSTLVIAHRTSPLNAPENSAEGVRRSIELGADAVEIDVRLGARGALVCSHDRTLRRAHGRFVPARFVSARRGLLGRAREVAFLADLVEALPLDASLAVDVKETRAMAPTIVELQRLDALRRSRLWVRSIKGIRVAADRAPEVERALLRNTHTIDASSRYVRDAAGAGATAVSFHTDAVESGGRELVDLARDLGLVAHCWIVRSDAHEMALNAGVDSVVTDWPALARGLIDRPTGG